MSNSHSAGIIALRMGELIAAIGGFLYAWEIVENPEMQSALHALGVLGLILATAVCQRVQEVVKELPPRESQQEPEHVETIVVTTDELQMFAYELQLQLNQFMEVHAHGTSDDGLVTLCADLSIAIGRVYTDYLVTDSSVNPNDVMRYIDDISTQLEHAKETYGLEGPAQA